MAQISRLTSRAGQSILENHYPSSPGYNGGTHFRRCAHQGCKKLARKKLMVINTFGDKTLSIIQTNYIIKAVKDEKRQNDEKDRQSCGCCCRRCMLGLAAKPLTQLPSRRLRLCPS
jgi:hypothetical protein